MPQLPRPGNPSQKSLSPNPGRHARFPRIAAGVVGLLPALCLVDPLIAQEGGGTGAPGPNGAGNVVVTQPFPWGGLFVTLIVVGFCLFTICRSSRRN